MSFVKYLCKLATLLAIFYLILSAPDILQSGRELSDLPQRLWRIAVGSAVGLALFVGASTGEEEAHRQGRR